MGIMGTLGILGLPGTLRMLGIPGTLGMLGMFDLVNIQASISRALLFGVWILYMESVTHVISTAQP